MKRQKGRANGTGEIVPVDKIDWRIIVLQKSSSVRTKTFGKRLALFITGEEKPSEELWNEIILFFSVRPYLHTTSLDFTGPNELKLCLVSQQTKFLSLIKR